MCSVCELKGVKSVKCDCVLLASKTLNLCCGAKEDKDHNMNVYSWWPKAFDIWAGGKRSSESLFAVFQS